MDDSQPSTVIPSSFQPSHSRLCIEFTGSGSEYFRIWIVNLLLMLVTLGLYFPWAKVRRLRYFCGNTLVDGEPLGFHGNPKKMFKGFVLVGVLFALYSVAGQFSPTAGFVALLIVVAIWPALFKSSMQFRLANTSWRGLRFGFHGTLKDAYLANVPLFIPGVLLVGMNLAVTDIKMSPNNLAMAAGGTVLLTLAFMPWLFWNLKQYQHNHYGLGHLQTQFRASAGSFYKLFLKVFGFALLVIVIATAAVAGIIFGASLSGLGGAMPKGPMVAFISLLGGLAGMAVVMIGIKPYAISRLQNLVWTQTGNSSLRFISKMRFRSMLWLTLKNWLLVVLTLGLYWPFAAVALARMRLETVSVKTSISPELLVASIRTAEGDAAADAAGDFFGLDIGL
ncbi:MAG: YjgN family protein [Pseudomonadota bacterium]